jgi:hypothetical protein
MRIVQTPLILHVTVHLPMCIFISFDKGPDGNSTHAYMTDQRES